MGDKMKTKYEKTLEDKLNLLNDVKKTNISKIHVNAIEYRRVPFTRVVPKKQYEFDLHC